MPVIYIDRRDVDLDLDAGALIVRLEGRRVASFPLAGAERVVLRRAGSISHRLLAGLGERGIGLLVFGGRRGEPRAQMVGRPHGDVTIRMGQFALARDSEANLNLARFAVRGKLVGQLRLLEEARARRPDLRKRLLDGSREMESLCNDLPVARTLDRLRGLEGAAAASFFRAYRWLFPASLEFTGRNRRPPRDPVNACLSLAYSLLHAEALRAAWIAGLDPMLGFLHSPLPGRPSLASDLVELCRPGAERWVWGLFRDRTLRAQHFHDVEGACLLGKAGRAVFYETYESDLARIERRRLRHAAALFARTARAAAADDTQLSLLNPLGEEEVPP